MHVVTDIARRVGRRRRALNAGGIQLAYTGGVAQLGERLLCKQEVIGSIPFTSTIILSSDAAACSACLARATGRGDPLGSRERYGMVLKLGR